MISNIPLQINVYSLRTSPYDLRLILHYNKKDVLFIPKITEIVTTKRDVTINSVPFSNCNLNPKMNKPSYK